MVFVGMRSVKCMSNGEGGPWNQHSIRHFNTDEIRLVDEKTMIVEMKTGVLYRVDEESLQIFLSAIYGEHNIRGDKLSEDDDGSG